MSNDLQPADAGVYSVAVENRVGAAVSEGARLVVGRLLRVEDTTGFRGERVEVPVRLCALGDENSLGASGAFDPAQIECRDVVPGAQTAGGSLLFNGTRPGRVGFGVALPAGQTFGPGWQKVARLGLRTAEPVSRLPMTFGHDPTALELADAAAQPLELATMDDHLTTVPRPVDVEQLPDLVAANLTAPPGALQGATIQVTWDVRIAGGAPATAAWVDRLWLVPVLGTLADGLELATRPAARSPLDPAAHYRQETAVTLPLSHAWPPGAYRLEVQADFGNAQTELDEANNQVALPFELTRPPLPDLVVTRVTAPAEARRGVPFELSWEVENRGPTPADPPWQEGVSFVHPVTGERSLALLDVTEPLAAGATVTFRDPFTHQAVAQGVTGADGTFLAEDLMEGFYHLEVGAPNTPPHASRCSSSRPASPSCPRRCCS